MTESILIGSAAQGPQDLLDNCVARERARRRSAVFVLLAAVFMSLLDVFIVNIAFPSIARHFSEANTSRLSWVLNGYTIVFAALLVPAGGWADRAGRKRAFLAGILLFIAASVLCALSISVWMLVGARVLQAAGAAMLSPAAMGLLLPEFPPEKRSFAIALFVAVGGVAATLGAPVGGLLTQLSWHWVFLVNVPIGIAAIFFGRRSLREIRGSVERHRPDILGALLLMGAIGLMVLAIVKGREWGWDNERLLGAIAAAAALLGWFFQRSRRHPAPVVELSILRVRTFAAANIAGLLFSTAFGGLILANVLFITGRWHPPSWLLGLQLMPGPVTAAAMAILAGRLSVRYGTRAVAIAGALLFATGTGWWIEYFDTAAATDYFTKFLPGSLLTGMGIGLSLPSVTSAALAALPSKSLSTGSAVLNMSRQIGTALGVAILVAIVGDAVPENSLGLYRVAYGVIGLAALGSGVAALGLSSRTITL